MVSELLNMLNRKCESNDCVSVGGVEKSPEVVTMEVVFLSAPFREGIFSG